MAQKATTIARPEIEPVELVEQSQFVARAGLTIWQWALLGGITLLAIRTLSGRRLG